MPFRANIQISFEAASTDDIDAVVDSIVAPDGATVMVGVTETVTATVPDGGGTPVLDSELSI